MRIHALCLVASVLLLTGCPPEMVECINGDESVCEDAGSLPPDFCNSKEEAESDSTNCHLTVTTTSCAMGGKQDVFLSRLSDGGVDQDWYFAQLPGGLTPRSLLHVNGGYRVPQTAVNFSLNVLKENGAMLTSVINGIDRHGAAAPKPVDLILPFSESSAKLWVLVADEAGAGQNRVDNRNPYSLCMEILENPDSNEPNDTMPTSIALTPGANGAQGTASGFLATNDDVDQFSFIVTGGGRQIVYLHLTETGMHPTNPPPPYRLSYTLSDPAGVAVAEGVMDNEFLPIDLATARLAVPAGGAYTLRVAGYKAPGSTAVIRGDLRVNYNIEVRVMPDLDMLEPNDTLMTARAVNFSGPGRQTLVGKLAHVPDDEWFRITIPARASPGTLRYTLTPSMTAGRYAPLSGTPARQIRIMKPITTGATTQDRQTNCRTDTTLCPRADDYDPMLHASICSSADPALCLYAQRNEENPRLANLRNLVGAIPVLPSGTPTEFLLVFRDEGQGASKYADDKDWSLVLEFADDADDAARAGGPTMVTLGGTTTVSTGELTFGYGQYLDSDWFRQSQALRGLNDYDAYDTDRDLFQFNFGGAMGDQSWEISWDLQHPDGGTEPPGELAFELTYCAGSGGNTMLCPNAERQRIFAFNDQSLTPWYLPQSVGNGRMLFTRQNMGTFTTYTAAPVGCWCHSGPRVMAGSFFANVAALHRTSNDVMRYRVSQRLAPYPGGFTLDGGAQTCPVADGGCGFAR